MKLLIPIFSELRLFIPSLEVQLTPPSNDLENMALIASRECDFGDNELRVVAIFLSKRAELALIPFGDLDVPTCWDIKEASEPDALSFVAISLSRLEDVEIEPLDLPEFLSSCSFEVVLSASAFVPQFSGTSGEFLAVGESLKPAVPMVLDFVVCSSSQLLGYC